MGHCLFKNIVIHHNVVRHKFQHYVDVFDYEKQKKKENRISRIRASSDTLGVYENFKVNSAEHI